MKKVLLVTQPTTEGVALHVIQLAKHLDKKKYTVQVASPGNADFITKVEETGTEHILWPAVRSISNPIQLLKELFTLVRILYREKPDIVHAQSSKAGAICRIARFFYLRVVVLYTPNAYAYFNATSKINMVLFLIIEKILAPFTTMTIAVSKSERDKAIKDGVVRSPKIVIINNGIESSSISGIEPDVDVLAKKKNGSLVINSIGRLSPQKAPQIMIKAIAKVLQKHQNLEIYLVGPGELEEECRAQISSLGIEHSFHLLGGQPYEKTMGILKASDIYMQTSLYEGMPYTIIEAMSQGLPVIATDATGNRDLVVDECNGLLCGINNVEEIAQNVIRLIEDKDLRKEMSENSSKIFKGSFTIESSIRKLELLYDNLVK